MEPPGACAAACAGGWPCSEREPPGNMGNGAIAMAWLTSGASRVDSRERTKRLRSAPGMSAQAHAISPRCSTVAKNTRMLKATSAHVPSLYAVMRSMKDTTPHAQGDCMWSTLTSTCCSESTLANVACSLRCSQPAQRCLIMQVYIAGIGTSCTAPSSCTLLRKLLLDSAVRTSHLAAARPAADGARAPRLAEGHDVLAGDSHIRLLTHVALPASHP